MAQGANVAATDKGGAKAAVEAGQKVAEKISDKVLEKRRALGRGLESLLGGPRVTVPPSPSAAKEVDAPAGSPAQSISQPNAGSPGTLPTISAQADAGETLESSAATATGAELMAATDAKDVLRVAIDLIDSNPHQTRQQFNKEPLQELADSIRVHGVMQPVVVRPGKEGRYTLILGERRVRASEIAGIETIPVIVRRVSDQQAAEMTVVENLQRQDLDCVDQAAAFEYLSREFNLTQEEIGARVGVARETVSNYTRLLILPEGVIGALQKGKLTFSHARSLLKLRDNVEIWKLAQKAINESLSVVQLEKLVNSAIGVVVEHPENKAKEVRLDPNVLAAQRSLEALLGVRVQVRDRDGKGKIVIEYGSLEDFDRVVGMLRGNA